MSTTGAFLSDVQAFIEEDDTIRTGVDTVLAPGALDRVDDDEAVLSLINSPFDRAGIHAGRLIAVHAEMRAVGDLDLGHSPPHSFGKLKPELPGIGLGLGDRRPIIGDMFILANNLTGMTAVALRYINNENLL
jgi:hypothetical protein